MEIKLKATASQMPEGVQKIWMNRWIKQQHAMSMSMYVIDGSGDDFKQPPFFLIYIYIKICV
jgi:hypothetical protein